MYNKLFTKILDSSIWLESCPTRIVWLTMIAVMDEDGFAQFASVANLAHRARVSLEEAGTALACLEGPDGDSSNPEHGGRRVERVPGGWLVLNAAKHREMVTRIVAREQNRIRVQRFRSRTAVTQGALHVTGQELHVTKCNTSEAVSEAVSEISLERAREPSVNAQGNGDAGVRARTLEPDEIAARGGRLVERYGELFQKHRLGAKYRPRPNLDWVEACDLCRHWDDARLEKLAIVVLTTDDPFIEKTDRGFKIFAMKASWADDRLRQWEIAHQIKA